MLPADLPAPLALAVLDVCGAPALTSRVVGQAAAAATGAASTDAAPPVVAVLGAAGKSGSLSAAAARRAGAGVIIGVVPDQAQAAVLRAAGLADRVVIADARDPVGLADAVRSAGGPAAVTVVCVDVPGCEGGAVLATASGGTVIFFSMATSFTAAALGAGGDRRRCHHADRERLCPGARAAGPGPGQDRPGGPWDLRRTGERGRQPARPGEQVNQ